MLVAWHCWVKQTEPADGLTVHWATGARKNQGWLLLSASSKCVEDDCASQFVITVIVIVAIPE
jgi:hypothetical protein